MHDPKFEKEVQKKLEELSFSPSDAVWTRVERAVKEDRRRRVPFFWFILLPALGLAGAVGLIYFSAGKSRKAVTPIIATTSATVDKSTASAPPTAAASSATAAGSATTGRPATTATLPGTTAASSVTAAGSSTTVMPAGPVEYQKHRIKRNRGSMLVGSTFLKTGRKDPQTGAEDPETALTGNPQTKSEEGMTSEKVMTTETVITIQEKRNATATLPGLRAFDHHFAAPTASRPAMKATTMTAAKTPIKLQPKYSWEAGFSGGIGLSSLNKTLFQQPVLMSSLAPNVAPITAGTKNYSSGIQPDISYWAGITAERQFRKSLTLSLGLNLHYYSARVQIGEKVYDDPSALYSSSSLFNSSTTPRVTLGVVYPYYSVGNADYFVNRYYFLEMPVSLLWQVNHSSRLPIFWENGLSLNYLISSNSLYYNSKSAVFYKAGGNVINKTQLNFATALLVGLPVKGVRLQVGPQVQYGLTSLQSLGSSGQHLFYGGIGLVLLPGKSKK